MQGHMHHKRRLLMAMAVSGGMVVGFGTAALPASAVVRTFDVTLLGKIHKTVTVDVGINTPLDQIRLPGLGSLPILSIRETTPANATPSSGLSLTITPSAPVQTPAAPAPTTPQAGEQLEIPAAPAKKSKAKGTLKALDTLGRLTDATSPRKPGRARPHATELRHANGIPTLMNPTMSLALPGPVPVGVPNFFINKFKIPPFLLSIYQAAGIQYGVRWEVLAAINEIETDYGRNLNVSSAGAMGWMQFIPSSWKLYGVDANGDDKKDPYNPVDAIFAAARYLKAAGAQEDLRKAIFAYNHADWYVESVLMRARLIGGLPSDLVGSLNGLTQGHFPVVAKARYADDLAERATLRRTRAAGNAAQTVEPDATRRGIDIFAAAGSPAIAVQDGTIAAIGGLMRQNQTTNRSGLPNTSDSRFLSNIFGSRNQTLTKSELVILLKVTVIKGDAAWAAQAREVNERIQDLARPPMERR